MTVEEKAFRRKSFVPEKMLAYGFACENGIYRFSADFMNGDFRAEMEYENGGYSCRVIDKMNDEEYVRINAEAFDGAYVNSVRAAYAELLQSVARDCCEDKYFVSDQANRITEHIYSRWGIKPDFPFGEDPYDECGAFRHPENKKWFALVMNVARGAVLKNGDKSRVDVVNLKSADVPGDLRAGVYPAYHMNHRLWISVLLDDTLDDAGITALVENSFALTAGRPRGSVRKREAV